MFNLNGNKILKKRIITIAALTCALLLLNVLSSHPAWIERYYSERFYRFICRILHPFFNIFPFSVGDLLYLAVVGYFIYACIRLTNLGLKKQFKTAVTSVLGFLVGILTGLLIFYLFWGMNYFRPPAGERLNLRDSVYSLAELKTVTAILIDSANVSRARLTAADLSQSNGAIYQTAVQAIRKLSSDSSNFRTYDPGIKSSILTPLLNYIGTSGYYDPFTGEAQINYQMPVFDRPVVACHEMSHQMGFGAEDEANFAGFLAGIGSHDRLLRYSAYHLAVDEFMHAVFYRDSLANKALKPRISRAVHQDFVTERAYWHSYQNQVEVLTSIFYDKFLKVNNQPQGLATYNRMVLLVMARYRNKLMAHSQ